MKKPAKSALPAHPLSKFEERQAARLEAIIAEIHELEAKRAEADCFNRTADISRYTANIGKLIEERTAICDAITMVKSSKMLPPPVKQKKPDARKSVGGLL